MICDHVPPLRAPPPHPRPPPLLLVPDLPALLLPLPVLLRTRLSLMCLLPSGLPLLPRQLRALHPQLPLLRGGRNHREVLDMSIAVLPFSVKWQLQKMPRGSLGLYLRSSSTVSSRLLPAELALSLLSAQLRTVFQRIFLR
jgi:hypothetical protein